MTQPAEAITTFDQVGELLAKQADAIGVVIHGYGPPWVAGSTGDADSGLDAAMEGTPYVTTSLLVGLYLNHAADHLRGAARLAADLGVIMGSVTLVRPVLGS